MKYNIIDANHFPQTKDEYMEQLLELLEQLFDRYKKTEVVFREEFTDDFYSYSLLNKVDAIFKNEKFTPTDQYNFINTIIEYKKDEIYINKIQQLLLGYSNPQYQLYKTEWAMNMIKTALIWNNWEEDYNDASRAAKYNNNAYLIAAENTIANKKLPFQPEKINKDAKRILKYFDMFNENPLVADKIEWFKNALIDEDKNRKAEIFNLDIVKSTPEIILKNKKDIETLDFFKDMWIMYGERVVGSLDRKNVKTYTPVPLLVILDILKQQKH